VFHRTEKLHVHIHVLCKRSHWTGWCHLLKQLKPSRQWRKTATMAMPRRLHLLPRVEMRSAHHCLPHLIAPIRAELMDQSPPRVSQLQERGRARGLRLPLTRGRPSGSLKPPPPPFTKQQHFALIYQSSDFHGGRGCGTDSESL